MTPDGVPGLVTGASSGIGEALARRLAGRAAPLLLVGRDRARLVTVAGVTGGVPLVADLTDPAGRQDVLAAAHRHGVGLVVHAAGIGDAHPLADTDAGSLDTVVATDLVAPLQLTRGLWPALRTAAAPGGRPGAGHVVFVASIAALGVGGEAAYSAAKAGLRSFADALRLEDPAVGVTTVLPGPVDTPFLARRGYARAFPPPVPAERVAAATLRAVARRRAEVFVPGWLRAAAVVHGAAPGVFTAMSRRFGGA